MAQSAGEGGDSSGKEPRFRAQDVMQNPAAREQRGRRKRREERAGTDGIRAAQGLHKNPKCSPARKHHGARADPKLSPIEEGQPLNRGRARVQLQPSSSEARGMKLVCTEKIPQHYAAVRAPLPAHLQDFTGEGICFGFAGRGGCRVPRTRPCPFPRHPPSATQHRSGSVPSVPSPGAPPGEAVAPQPCEPGPTKPNKPHKTPRTVASWLLNAQASHPARLALRKSLLIQSLLVAESRALPC